MSGPLFRFSGWRGRTLLSAAVYQGAAGPILFLWVGARVLSLPLWGRK